MSPYLNLTRGGNPAINYNTLVRPQIETARPFGPREPARDGIGGHTQAGSIYDSKQVKGDRRVDPLMGTAQAHVHAAHIAPGCANQRRAPLARDSRDHRIGFRRQLTDDDRHAAFDDARLLGRDVAERRTEIQLMIEANRRDRRRYR